MGELLGIGLTHAPMFQFPDASMASIFERTLDGPDLPSHLKDPANWPEPMRAEWGEDRGLAAAARHRTEVVDGFRRARAALEEFQPDAVLVFGDDQYENFREDVVPTFCSYFFGDMEVLPFQASSQMKSRANVWGLPEDTKVRLQGNQELGVHLATGLIESGFDIAWSMKPHHLDTLGHAFMRTLIYLDYDQKGFPWPYLPFHVNSYGSDIFRDIEKSGAPMSSAPPAPSPARCFALGRQIGQVLRDSPYRVAVVGSSSWSHAFLTKSTHGLYPDVPSDEARLKELERSAHAEWADLTLEQIHDAGQHELLNWICMAGAMADATAEVLAFVPTYIFNSTKVVAVLRD